MEGVIFGMALLLLFTLAWRHEDFRPRGEQFEAKSAGIFLSEGRIPIFKLDQQPELPILFQEAVEVLVVEPVPRDGGGPNELTGREVLRSSPFRMGGLVSVVAYPNERAHACVIRDAISKVSESKIPHYLSPLQAGPFDALLEQKGSFPILQNLDLGFERFCSFGGLVPCIVSENSERQREKGTQIVGQVVGLSDRARKPAEKSAERSPEKSLDIIPAALFLAGAALAVLGFGMIATGCHVFGVLCLIAAIICFWFPYQMSTQEAAARWTEGPTKSVVAGSLESKSSELHDESRRAQTVFG